MKRLARTDLAIQTRLLRNQSIWCGVVFGLLVLITVLNVLPPVEVNYLVSGKLIASPIRAQALSQQLRKPSAAIETLLPSLQRVTVLDDPGSDQTQSLVANQPVILLGLNSIWHSRCNLEQFHNWLESITSTVESQRAVVSTDTSQELRMARWEFEAARHYRSHHEFLTDTIFSTPVAPHTAEKGVFVLASSSVATGSAGKSSVTGNAGMVEQLDQQLKASQQRFEILKQQSVDEQNRIVGQVQLTDGPNVSPRCPSIPVWMASSVLILGLAAGLSIGWLQLRLQSGGVYDPHEVALQLSRAGLPNVAEIQFNSDPDDDSDWLAIAGQKTSAAGQFGGRNLVLLGESGLAIWCVIILGRACFDPLWRSLMVENPLAALGRLLTGMP